MARAKTKKATRTGKRRASAKGGDDAAQMGELADLGLTLEGANVVTQFAEIANRGNTNGLDTMFDVASPRLSGDEPEADPIGFSQALAWNAEPEWQGESSEAEAEIAIGSREPESQSL